jgi:hypothetical protein
MLFAEAARSADLRDRERIKKAENSRDVDRALLRLQRNEQFHDRVVRACLGVKPSEPITATLKALTVAAPEILLQKCYLLGWGPARKQGEAVDGPPGLLEDYQTGLAATDFSFAGSGTIEVDITPDGPISEVLVCHGLSPTPDTVLLLADIGRAARLSYALGLADLRVMLADVSWMRHNRSVLGHFADEDEYADELRVCQDHRIRIYKALKLKHDVFSISPFEGSSGISRPRLQKASERYRQLAAGLWGDQVLEAHNSDTKALIGQSFNGVNSKNRSVLPGPIQALLKFRRAANAIETSLSRELRILRSLSELFSSFDEDIFVYYFAQFFAQDKYDHFLKVAVCTEAKFDTYFEKHYEYFKQFAQDGSSSDGEGEATESETAIMPPLRRYAYFPQYQLADLELLPYSSLSLDVVKAKEPLRDLLGRLILLEDCGLAKRDEHLAKIGSVLNLTPIGARNRLVSDLLSFAHLLVTRVNGQSDRNSPLGRAIAQLGTYIAEDIFSSKSDMTDYPLQFSNWLNSIDKDDSILPFHLKPYTWDEEKWTSGAMEKSASFIFELLMTMRRICE